MSRLRPATREDVSGMHRVRLAVLENRLTTTVIDEADYIPAIESTGRGWVVECDDGIIGFAIANGETGSIWALFVEPSHEGRGHGKRLHDTAVTWLWSRGLEKIWLNTEPGTRAQGFYRSLGWTQVGATEDGEVLFERLRPRHAL